MNSVESIAKSAATGIWGLDNILSGGFEALGTARRAISIVKKRTGAREATIREYRIDGRGLTIGDPLDGFQGVLRGVPVYVGDGRPLLEEPAR
jgi:circadian clock protein KaiC